jgi:hypothetical protein
MKIKQLLLSALTAILFTLNSLAQTVPSYVPTNGLVGWWPFNGNANDESGNGINGTAIGATLTTNRFGNSNSAYAFNGSSNVINCGNSTNALLNLNSSITISAWVNASCFGCGNYANMIVSKHRSSGPNGYVFGFWNGGMINYQATPNFDASTYPAGQSGFITTNVWRHCILKYDASSTSLYYYLNGILVDTKLLAFNVTSNTDDLVFGAQRNGAGTGYLDFFSGKLDDIGIWNRALTQQEITNLYNSSSVGLNEFNNSKLFSVYPNPAKHQINIKADASLINSAYSIYDYTGKLILSGKLTSENSSIELTNLAQGIYMLTIGDSNKQTFKLVRD